jgi:hypothetical protein
MVVLARLSLHKEVFATLHVQEWWIEERTYCVQNSGILIATCSVIIVLEMFEALLRRKGVS